VRHSSVPRSGPTKASYEFAFGERHVWHLNQTQLGIDSVPSGPTDACTNGEAAAPPARSKGPAEPEGKAFYANVQGLVIARKRYSFWSLCEPRATRDLEPLSIEAGP
jgi:hypothetical protein